MSASCFSCHSWLCSSPASSLKSPETRRAREEKACIHAKHVSSATCLVIDIEIYQSLPPDTLKLEVCIRDFLLLKVFCYVLESGIFNYIFLSSFPTDVLILFCMMMLPISVGDAFVLFVQSSLMQINRVRSSRNLLHL